MGRGERFSVFGSYNNEAQFSLSQTRGYDSFVTTPLLLRSEDWQSLMSPLRYFFNWLIFLCCMWWEICFSVGQYGTQWIIPPHPPKEGALSPLPYSGLAPFFNPTIREEVGPLFALLLVNKIYRTKCFSCIVTVQNCLWRENYYWCIILPYITALYVPNTILAVIVCMYIRNIEIITKDGNYLLFNNYPLFLVVLHNGRHCILY